MPKEMGDAESMGVAESARRQVGGAQVMAPCLRRVGKHVPQPLDLVNRGERFLPQNKRRREPHSRIRMRIGHGAIKTLRARRCRQQREMNTNDYKELGVCVCVPECVSAKQTKIVTYVQIDAQMPADGDSLNMINATAVCTWPSDRIPSQVWLGTSSFSTRAFL